MKEPESMARRWSTQLVLTIFSVYFYILMEWLFFATKLSFMSTLERLDMVKVLLTTSLPFAIAGTILLFLAWIPAIIGKTGRSRSFSSAAGLAIPAIILGLALLLLIDNFTYTVFHFGIKTISGWQSLAYALLILSLIAFTYMQLSDLETRFLRISRPGIPNLVALGLILVSAAFTIAAYNPSGFVSLDSAGTESSPKQRPNILMIASDGLNAGHMSVYGYNRATTPFIEKLAEDALLCENCFTNAGSSGGSIASTFTGRLPTQTRCIYPPDILSGKDIYWHLPGILKKLGYRNLDVSIKHYADPYDLNMKRSFDQANYKHYRTVDNAVSEYMTNVFGPSTEYFIMKLYERISERLLHSFLVHGMGDPYREVTRPMKNGNPGTGESEKQEPFERKKVPKHIRKFFEFIDESDAPFFAHLHLLGTHGPKFKVRRGIFSAGQKQNNEWMDDFYDDAILSFDDEVKTIVTDLRKRGSLGNTVIIICTDHGQRFSIEPRLPLIFVFPDGKHKGRLKENVQNLDIAPTLLDYLGIEKPERMVGSSLISGKIDPMRPIFSVDRKHGWEIRVKGKYVIDEEMLKPPFYSLGTIGVFICERLYRMHLEKNAMTIHDVEGHTSPCGNDRLPDPDEAEQLLIDHLDETGYNTSSIKRPLQVKYAD